MTSTHSRRLRRTVTATASVVVAALALSGCSASDESSAGGDVTLRFTWWGSESREALTQKVIDAFEAENPTIKVEGEYADFGGYFDRLSTSAAASDLPDVVTLTDPYMYNYVDNSQLVDLSDYSDVLPTSDFSDASLANMTIDDGLYGVPAGSSAFGIVINPSLFEAAGVEIPDDTTWTWDDYTETAVAISKATPAVTGSGLFLLEQAMQAYIRQEGEDYWADGGAELGFDADSAASWWSYLLDLSKSGGAQTIESAVEAASLSPEQTPIALGTMAMTLVAVGQLGTFDPTGDKLQLLQLPGDDSGKAVGSWTNPGQWYSISSKSEHPEEAAAFIDFMVNSPEAGQINKFDRGVPSNSTVLEALTPNLTPTEQQIAEFFADVNSKDPAPFPRQNTEAGPVLIASVQRLTQEVLFERMTPDEAAAQLITEVEAEL